MEYSDAEPECRVRAGVSLEIELFGSSAPAARVLRRGGVIASVSPATPERSLFNSVCADDPDELPGLLDELEATYAAAGVRAWTVWLPAGHPVGPGPLAERGHVLDGAPRSMGVALDKGYDYPETREIAAERKLTLHLRTRGEEVEAKGRDPNFKARRWVVERSHSWLNRNRGLLIRWAKKPENHRAFHHLAFGVIAFRAAGAGGLPR